MIRKDGFAGPIKLSLEDPPPGFTAASVSLVGTQTVARLVLKTDLATTPEPVNLKVVGTAKIQDRKVTRPGVPAEDRMQAFLWRHLVPAANLKALVFDPSSQPPPKRTPRLRPPAQPDARPVAAATESVTNQPAGVLADPLTNKPTAIVADSSTNKPAGPLTNAVPPKPSFTKKQVAAVCASSSVSTKMA